MARFRMQDKIDVLLSRLVELRDTNLAKEYIQKNEEKVLNLNRDQLKVGQRSDSSQITPFYADIRYKGRFSPVDLRLTGGYYNSLKIKYIDKGFFVESDAKAKGFDLANHLLKRYGNNVLGLTENSIQELRKELRIFIEKEIKIKLNVT